MVCEREGTATFLLKAERLQKGRQYPWGCLLLSSWTAWDGWSAAEQGSGSRDESCSAFFEPGPFQWQILPS